MTAGVPARRNPSLPKSPPNIKPPESAKFVRKTDTRLLSVERRRTRTPRTRSAGTAERWGTKKTTATRRGRGAHFEEKRGYLLVRIVVVVAVVMRVTRSVGTAERQDTMKVTVARDVLVVPFGRRRGSRPSRETVVLMMNVAVKSRLLRLIPLPVQTRLFHRGIVNKYHHEMTA